MSTVTKSSQVRPILTISIILLQVLVILQRMLKLLSGAGLSINEQHVYCGDYIYSGHTMTLVMTFLIIKECESMCRARIH